MSTQLAFILTRYIKGIAAFIAPGAATLIVAMTDASPGGQHITGNEWLYAAIIAVTSSAAVIVSPANREPDETISVGGIGDPNV